MISSPGFEQAALFLGLMAVFFSFYTHCIMRYAFEAALFAFDTLIIIFDWDCSVKRFLCSSKRKGGGGSSPDERSEIRDKL